jgi:glyoxylase-like metal-dependent hydrolase (beta-lactamase superfamily II)
MIEIIPGKIVQVTKRVRRLTAPNAGIMTGPGTNTYLVGSEQVAVIDPGPADPSHIDAILQSCGDRLRWILVTHTHPDHSPAAAVLAKATGAKVMGNALAFNDGFQDDSFSADKSFVHNERFVTDEFSIQALYTPGHVNNHLCFLIEEDGLLLTGDHIMQGSTVVIVPPHGDMKAYIESLQLLLDYPMTALGPAHGYIIDQPEQEIQRLISHRLSREEKVIAAMLHKEPQTLDDLVRLVYRDIDENLYRLAKFSLWAHLLKLEKEQRARVDNELWQLN